MHQIHIKNLSLIFRIEHLEHLKWTIKNKKNIY